MRASIITPQTDPQILLKSRYALRVEVELGAVSVAFIDLVHLKENKKASGRHQDLADIEHLQ